MEMSKDKGSLIKKVGRVIQNAWKQYSFVFAIILLVYITTIQLNGKVFKWGHFTAILSSQNTVIVGTIALGMALVIITGQIDLSVGSSLVLSTGAAIMAFNITNNVFIMFLVAVLAGGICGGINGVLAGFAKMPPFIVTLGTMLIYRSLTLSLVRDIDPSITGSSSSQFSLISDHSNYEALRMQFGTGSIPGISIPYITFVFLFCTLLILFVSKNTKYGKSVYATGSNEKATHLAGVNVQWMKVSVFIITGLLVGVGAFVQACKIGNVTPASSGKAYEMYAIAA